MEGVSLLLILLFWTPQHDHFSNPLHHGRTGLGTNRVAHGLPGVPVAVKNLHLDELVGRQRAIDFPQDSGGHAAVADLYSRFEWMSSRLEVGPLARGQ